MKKSTRFISFFLAMVMILSLFTTVASAEESESSKETETQQSDNTTTTQPIEVELFEDYESFDVQKAPDIITAAEIAQNGYIGRVKSHEKDLYTLVFRNSDGTNTKKIYSHPVKYVDDTGVVRDISLEIGQNKDGSFSTASHEIITTFEKNPLNGITLDYENVSIKMVPALTGNKVPAAVRSSDNRKITYSLDSSTSYVYELTYTGYKEDIVVKKYTGQTEYMFKLYTNGLTLTKINETYCLVDSEGEVKATIGDVIIFTADERNNIFGSMTYQTVRQNQEYNITIHIDADYLRDPRTVYPIRIDPTIEIRYSNNGAGAIEDVTLNSNAGSDGSSTSLLIGKRNTYGISRVLLRVPALSFDEIPYAVSITSATIAIRDIMCQSSSLDIYCHQFTGGEWTESTANWSNVNPNSYGTCLDSHTVSYANGVAQPSDHSYAFDITSLVRQWYSNPSAQNMGVIFKASDTVEGASAHNHKTFGSYSSSYRPVFTLVYESVTPVIINFTTISLLEGESYTLAAGSSLSGAVIYWSSADSSIASCGTYVGTTTTVTAGKAGTTTITATAHITGGFTYTATCKVNVYLPDGVYYIKNMNSNLYLHSENSGTANYTDVIQYSKYSTSANIISRLSQMWKIHHIGNGIYTVRPMHQPNLALDVSSGNVDLYTKSDSNIINDIKWTIVWNSTGYVFRNNGSDSKTMQIENASASSSASVKASTYSSTSANCRWAITAAEAVALYDTSTGIALSEPTKHISPGQSKTLSQLNLMARGFSGKITSQSFTWASNDPSVLSVNSTTGKITGVSTGKAKITGTVVLNGTSYYVVFWVCVGYPDFFESMIDDGLFTADTLDNTDDGFFISTVPISTILNTHEIYQLPNNANNTSFTNVLAYYDDWYIFSVVNGTTTKYGLYKMREQENDHLDQNEVQVADGDDPGVSISFISFNVNLLEVCIEGAHTSELINLLQEMDSVISPDMGQFDDIDFDMNLQDTDIVNYFANVMSDGPYLIADTYINFIAQKSWYNGTIDIPNKYDDLLAQIAVYEDSINNDPLTPEAIEHLEEKIHRLNRVRNALRELNAISGYTIFNEEAKTLAIASKNNLTNYEKLAILISHTSNVNIHSFAAEVEFHADALYDPLKIVKLWYSAAIIANMGIGEDKESGLFEDFYDLEGDLVQAQINAHSNY